MATAENPYAGHGPVLLDIGGPIGALVVAMPAALEGAEIEIRPQQHAAAGPHSDHQHLPHVAVLPRPSLGGTAYSAVFPELEEGSYELYERPAGPVRLSVTVRGSEVTHASWPG